jgi:hypothetical protein
MMNVRKITVFVAVATMLAATGCVNNKAAYDPVYSQVMKYPSAGPAQQTATQYNIQMFSSGKLLGN